MKIIRHIVDQIFEQVEKKHTLSTGMSTLEDTLYSSILREQLLV